MMTQEEYNLLDADFVHCPGKQGGRAKNAYATPPTRWLAENTQESSTVVHPDEKVVYEAMAWMNKVGRVLQ